MLNMLKKKKSKLNKYIAKFKLVHNKYIYNINFPSAIFVTIGFWNQDHR